MPRIYASNNDPYDFCQRCFPSEKKAKEEYGDLGDGPDGRGDCFEYDTDHPDFGGDSYKCCECGRELKERDNYKT